MKTGKFLTFEGLDGGGKSTQAKHLAQWLRDEHGLNVVETREPGGTPLGEKLRQLVLAGKAHDPISETLLMLTARCEHISKVINRLWQKANGWYATALPIPHTPIKAAGAVLTKRLFKRHQKKCKTAFFPI